MQTLGQSAQCVFLLMFSLFHELSFIVKCSLVAFLPSKETFVTALISQVFIFIHSFLRVQPELYHHRHDAGGDAYDWVRER